MTNPVFVVPSVEETPSGLSNCPINISHCTYLHKESFITTKLTFYSIRFEGCFDDNNQPHGWGYSTEKERDADYDRILKAFAVTTDEPKPEPKPELKPVSGEEVLEDVINWLEDNATAHVVQALRKAYGSEK